MSFPEELVWDKINDGWTRMSRKQRFLWEAIKRMQEEWELRGYDRCWVVALMGPTVIYYNHFESGFNLSPWHQYGYIERYQSLQYGLEQAVQRQLAIIDTGHDTGPWGSPPMPGEYRKS
ncbi:hypothetical protein AB9F45_17910 [Rhizobium leguminosarum]|uniref:hypothetical protein n=2 Tax=Rhizobium leguminosarum TaxID=384 RepID=UPI001C9484BE|nr:hypothetical protein [Rhizobium leguminosarum]MBY5317929.1 hypothetical protein [Rhizobium leguminosarum]